MADARHSRRDVAKESPSEGGAMNVPRGVHVTRALLLAVLVALTTAVAATGARAETPAGGHAPEAAWVQLGPSGVVLVRAITKASACPKVTLDNATMAMN